MNRWVVILRSYRQDQDGGRYLKTMSTSGEEVFELTPELQQATRFELGEAENLAKIWGGAIGYVR